MVGRPQTGTGRGMLMKGDAQSYGRATVVSILGLVLQAAAAIAVGIYAALSGGDAAAQTAAYHIALGIFVWAPLVFLFDMHRRERREAVEIERLAQDEPTGVFETDEQPRAARSLEAMRRFVLPAMSLLIGGSLLAIGLVRFRAANAADGSLAETELQNQGFGIAIGLAVAVAGFVFARFVSGMATQRIWIPLKAGASFAVGTALLGLAITVARFIDTSFGRPIAGETLAHAVPIFTLILGAEMLLNFVLDIYRPRTPGEDPRPGFDSRLLGLLAAPDKIAENIGEALNYQFGVEVSKSWFYLLIQRWWPGLIAVALLVAWSMTALVVIEPHQRALVLAFGSPSDPLLSFGERSEGNGSEGSGSEIGPGLHVVLPWPMTEVYVPKSVPADPNAEAVMTSTGVRVLRLGTNPPKPNEAILWTNEHTVQEVYSLVQPAPIGQQDTGASGADVAALSLVAVEIPAQYVIDSVRAYDELAQPDHRDTLLDVMGERMLMQFMASQQIDQVLGGRRTELGVEVGERLSAVFGAMPGAAGETGDAGIELLHVGVAGVHPPKDAAPYFERVVHAGQLSEAKVEAAREYASRRLNTVSAPIERDDGTVIRPADIVSLIDELKSMSRSGADEVELAEQELVIQRLLEEAGGSAGASLIEASATRWTRHMGERAKAALFQGQVASYRAAPSLYMTGAYFDALAEVMRGSRVYLTGEGIDQLNVNVKLETQNTSIDVFDPEAGGPTQ
jgi:membrane protease subunit HflK